MRLRARLGVTLLLVAAGLAGPRQALSAMDRMPVVPILCKPTAARSQAKTGEPPPPADSRGFDVLTYDLDLRLDPASSSITGQVVISYRAEQELEVLLLDLVPELTVTGLNDTRGELSFNHAAESLAVTLRAPLPAGQTDSVTINWTGRPPRHGSYAAGLMFRRHDAGTRTDPTDDVPIIANLSETWSAHSWWPCKDHPADKALVSLAVTVPDTLSAVSNGTLLSVTPTEPGWRRYTWRERYPLPTYLVSVAVSNYVTWSEPCRPGTGPEVRLDYHIFPQDRDNAAYDLANTCEMMSFLTDLLGPWPYPGEKYAQVEFKWIGGMEHTTATSLARLLFTGDRRFETLFLHEMVHQWLGDSLTPAVWADVWLNEGFARYGEALWLEHSQGQSAYNEFMHRIGPGNHPELFRGDGVLIDPAPILPNTLVYDKGAWVLHMLRGLIGDDLFFTFLRDYASDPRLVHGSVTTSDMIANAELVVGASLSDFFKPWLETDSVPVVGAEFRNTATGQVIVTLSQHQQPLFQVPVPLLLHGACGETRVTARLLEAVQNFAFPVDCPVDSVTIAPEGLALLRSLDSPPPQLTVLGPAPNPVTARGAEFNLFLETSSEVVVKTYDTRGRHIASKTLGHLPANGQEAAPAHIWHWAGTDDAGHPLSAGLYYLEFKSSHGRQVRRATVVH